MGGLSVLLVEHPATLRSFIGVHEAHFADLTEAQSVDPDCHHRETSTYLDNFRAVLACHCGEHRAHLADLLESLRQVEALADHPWSVSMERDLADALAASKAGSAVMEDASGSTCRSRRSPQPSAGPGPSGERGAPRLWLTPPPEAVDLRGRLLRSGVLI